MNQIDDQHWGKRVGDMGLGYSSFACKILIVLALLLVLGCDKGENALFPEVRTGITQDEIRIG